MRECCRERERACGTNSSEEIVLQMSPYYIIFFYFITFEVMLRSAPNESKDSMSSIVPSYA
jgi:hypothetical protein